MNSVIQEPTQGLLSIPYSDIVISIASAADDIPAWGSDVKTRDIRLREFWPTEPVLASAIFSTISRYVAFGWTVIGPPRTTQAVRTMINERFDRGAGWISLGTKTLTDLFTQDNGAFLEIVRKSDSPDSPVIALNHLDAGRCTRTGVRDTPVIYQDIMGKYHYLKWYDVLALSEFPSPIETMRGMQYCCVTRLLRAAQIVRDISIYKREKISGRFAGNLYLVSGVHNATITDKMKEATLSADAQGMSRYILPVVIASLDPTAHVNVATIPLASLPDNFDEEIAMRWYVNQLALAFGGDYQDYAPLPGGNLGSSEQSQTLHMKSRGKGSRLFMSMMEYIFNFKGILPKNVKFMFGEQDLLENVEQAKLRKTRAEEREIRIRSGEITPEIARQIAVDMGDLDPRYMTERDLTDTVILSGSK